MERKHLEIQPFLCREHNDNFVLSCKANFRMRSSRTQSNRPILIGPIDWQNGNGYIYGSKFVFPANVISVKIRTSSRQILYSLSLV